MMSARLTPGQIHLEVKGNKPATLAAAIEKHADAHIASADSSVLTIVLTNVTTLDVLVGIAQALGATAHWNLSLRKLENTKKHAAHIGFVINRMIPFGYTQLPSEGLFLGPFYEFPKTRRAPVVAFELFVGEPLPNDPKTKQPSTKANLAHISIPAAAPGMFETMWTNTKKGRRRSLEIGVSVEDADEVPTNIDDLRAKAKMAFAIPASTAKRFGIKV